MPDQPSDIAARTQALLKGLGISGEQIQNAKLGPGVVGRNSKIAYTFLLLASVAVVGAIYVRSQLLIGVIIGLAFIVAVGIPLLNVVFGHKNPAAAILEGAEFLQYQQIMASRDNPVIFPALPVKAKPKELSEGVPGGEKGEGE
jgi:hypothetical protein